MQVAPLINYLRSLEERGQSHIYLDQTARENLRELYKAERAAKRKVRDTITPSPKPAKAELPKKKASVEKVQSSAKPLISKLVVVDGDNEEKIQDLSKQASSWAPAHELGTLRDTMVFSVGNPNAELMLVGEAPGYYEEKEQEPFVGPAGQKLTAMLKAMGLTRESVYISNIVKFRPAAASQELTPTSNRAPSQVEMDACLPLIEAEVEVLKPKCIIAFGATAGNGLLGGKRAVGALRGTFHEFEGTPVRVTYHPSYILRSENGPDAVTSKRAVWEDLLAVMEFMNMPVSEKQKNYFSSK